MSVGEHLPLPGLRRRVTCPYPLNVCPGAEDGSRRQQTISQRRYPQVMAPNRAVESVTIVRSNAFRRCGRLSDPADHAPRFNDEGGESMHRVPSTVNLLHAGTPARGCPCWQLLPRCRDIPITLRVSMGSRMPSSHRARAAEIGRAFLFKLPHGCFGEPPFVIRQRHAVPCSLLLLDRDSGLGGLLCAHDRDPGFGQVKRNRGP